MSPLSWLFPEGASATALGVDHLFYFLCALSFAVAAVLTAMILAFAVRYRARAHGERAPMRGAGVDEEDVRRLEFLWIAGPLVVFLAIFYWGATLFASMASPPRDAMQVFIVGKQWMWKAQHLGGRREINELHVPVGRAVKLTMTSEDVIHSFYVPAFRVKMDVLPSRYTTMWFRPTRPGVFHLFCAEYCGTKHSAMIGSVIAMEPRDFQAWLGGGARQSLAEAGEKLFGDLGCATCHKPDGQGRGPRLVGLFGRTVQLQNGDRLQADEAYLRESIMEPNKRVVAGYQPVMPTYVAQLDEEKVIQLIAYLRSLQEKPPQENKP